MKYFEVTVVATKTYTIKAENEARQKVIAALKGNDLS